MLSVYPHLEDIPTYAMNWKVQPRGALQLATTLAAHREEALLYRKLATLVEEVPLAESLAGLQLRGVPRERFEKWCDDLGVARLKTVPKRWR